VFESLLDAIAGIEHLRQFVPELSFRGGLSDRGAARILSLAKAGSIEPWEFRRFSFGGVIRNLSEHAFHEWTSFLLELNTLASVGTARRELCSGHISWTAVVMFS